MGIQEISRGVAELSEWIDRGNEDRNPEAETWARLAKISEEAGEVVAAYIGATGQNPRKGTTHTLADVEDELLDVAITALAALEHVRGHDARSVELMDEKLQRTLSRAGLRSCARISPVAFEAGHHLPGECVTGIAQHLGSGALFDDASLIHESDIAAQPAHQIQIVRDEKIGQPEFALQGGEQFHDLGLHRDIEHRGRLVLQKPNFPRPEPEEAVEISHASSDPGRGKKGDSSVPAHPR